MAEQLGLNFGTGCTVIRQADGGVLVKPVQTRLRIEGGTKEAAKVLRIPQRTIVDMIQRGAIRAAKAREGRNVKYRVDMISVYELREKMDKSADCAR